MKHLALALTRLLRAISKAYLIQLGYTVPFFALIFVCAPATSSVDDVAATTLIWCICTQVVLVSIAKVFSAVKAVQSSPTPSPLMKVALGSVAIAFILSCSSLAGSVWLTWILPIGWAAHLLIRSSVGFGFFSLYVFALLVGYRAIHSHIASLDIAPIVSAAGVQNRIKAVSITGNEAFRTIRTFKKAIAA